MPEPLHPTLRPLALEVAKRLFVERQTVDEIATAMGFSRKVIGWLGSELAFDVLRPSAEALHTLEIPPNSST